METNKSTEGSQPAACDLLAQPLCSCAQGRSGTPCAQHREAKLLQMGAAVC